MTNEANGSLSAINGLEGIVKTVDKEIEINGDAVTVTGAGTATLTYGADASGITEISGLTNNATVKGAENAALNLVGSASTSIASSLTVGDNTFKLLNDKDGVTITGGKVVEGLDSGASLVADAGTYTINGTELAVAAGETIRGTSEGTAEIYSADNVAEVDKTTAENAESLAAAIIDTTEYATVSTASVEAAFAEDGDKSVLDGDLKFAATMASGEKEQELDFTENTGRKDVTLSDTTADGTQAVKFNDAGGNVAQVSKDAKGTKEIELGNGGDVAVIAAGTKATVSVTAGKGSDSIVSGADATVDVSAGGATKMRAVSGAKITAATMQATRKPACRQRTAA